MFHNNKPALCILDLNKQGMYPLAAEMLETTEINEPCLFCTPLLWGEGSIGCFDQNKEKVVTLRRLAGQQ